MKDGQAGPEAMYQFCQRLAGGAHLGCRHEAGAGRNGGRGTPPTPLPPHSPTLPARGPAAWVLLPGNEAGLASLKEGPPNQGHVHGRILQSQRKRRDLFYMGFASLQTKKLHVFWHDNDSQA